MTIAHLMDYWANRRPVDPETPDGLHSDLFEDQTVTLSEADYRAVMVRHLPALLPGPDNTGRQARWNFCHLASDSWLLDSRRVGRIMAHLLATRLDAGWWSAAWTAATREPHLRDAPFCWAWPLAMHLGERAAGDVRAVDIQAMYAVYDVSKGLDEHPTPAGKVLRVPEAELLQMSAIDAYCDPQDNYLPAWFDRTVGPWGVFVKRDGEARE